MTDVKQELPVAWEGLADNGARFNVRLSDWLAALPKLEPEQRAAIGQLLVIDAVLNLRDDERRAANVLLLHRGGRYIADNAQQDGYREMADKCASLEQERDAAIKWAEYELHLRTDAERKIANLDCRFRGMTTQRDELRAETEKLRGELAEHEADAAGFEKQFAKTEELRLAANREVNRLTREFATIAEKTAERQRARAADLCMFRGMLATARDIAEMPLVTDAPSKPSGKDPKSALGRRGLYGMWWGAQIHHDAIAREIASWPEEKTSADDQPLRTTAPQGGKELGLCSYYDGNPCRKRGRPQSFRRKSDGFEQTQMMCDSHRGQCNSRWEPVDPAPPPPESPAEPLTPYDFGGNDEESHYMSQTKAENLLAEASRTGPLRMAEETIHSVAVSCASFIAAIDSDSRRVAEYLERRLKPLAAVASVEMRTRDALERIARDARKPESPAEPRLRPCDSPGCGGHHE